MTDMEGRIREFEEKYLVCLRRWGSFVDPDELDKLTHLLQEMENDSKAITKTFRDNPGPLYEKRWLPLLKDLNGLLPGIQRHLETIRAQSREALSLLKKGQRGLLGYRGTVGRRRSILDEDG